MQLDPTSQRDLRAVARRLRTVADAKAIRKELTAGLRTAAKPAEHNVKAAARALPARGPKSTGLRRRIAAATGIQVRTAGNSAGVKVRIVRSRMGDQAVLPQRMNTGRWRHPVFGRRVRVAQTSQAGWFDRANRRARNGVRAELGKVLDRIERRLS